VRLSTTWTRPGARAVVVALALACSTAGCSDDPGATAAAGGSSSGAESSPGSPAPSAPSTSSTSPAPSGSPSRSTTRKPSPTGGASGPAKPGRSPSAGAAPSRGGDPVVKEYRRVLRDGQPSAATVSARPTTFDGTVRYGDGLRLTVDRVRQAKVTAQGPGEFPGAPKTQVDLRMTNDGRTPVRLDQVVVTALYGADRRQARPVYDDASRDFSGDLRPGRSARAVYSFSIPRPDLDRVTMIVDFDGRHTVATFRGDPRVAEQP